MNQIPYNQDIEELEVFLSALFSDFYYSLDRFRVEEETPQPKNAWSKFYLRLKNEFYRLERDDIKFLLLPLDRERIIGIDDCDKILYLKDETEDDVQKEYANTIDLSFDWIMYRSKLHPELIDDYIESFKEELIELDKERAQISTAIDQDMQIMIYLKSMKKKQAKEKEL